MSDSKKTTPKKTVKICINSPSQITEEATAGTSQSMTCSPAPCSSPRRPRPGSHSSRPLTNTPASYTDSPSHTISTVQEAMEGLKSMVVDVTKRLIGADSKGSSRKTAVSRKTPTRRGKLSEREADMRVEFTMTAKNPIKGNPNSRFRGYLFLHTNDLRVSEEVDQLMEERRIEKSRKSTGSRTSPGNGSSGASTSTAAAGTEDSDEENEEPEGRNYNDMLKMQNKEDEDKENDDLGGDRNDNSRLQKNRKRGNRVFSPATVVAAAGKRVGPVITSTKLDSLETNLKGRLDSVLSILARNGYSVEEVEVGEQTSFAQISLGFDQIAFQKVHIWTRKRTPDDDAYIEEARIRAELQEEESDGEVDETSTGNNDDDARDAGNDEGSRKRRPKPSSSQKERREETNHQLNLSYDDDQVQ